MLKNYFKTAFRKLSRHKSYTTINVLGLSLGIASALLIYQMIVRDLSQDNFHSKKDRLYRINTVHTRQEGTVRMSASQFPLIQAVRLNFPSLDNATLVDYEYQGLFTVDYEKATAKKFQEKTGVVFLEPAFFEMFDFPWIQGSSKSLNEPNTVVLTESAAKKFFGTVEAIGKTIRYENKTDLKVVGIARDFPSNTDFPFSIMISLATLKSLNRDMTQWNSSMSNLNTYVLLPANYLPPQLEEQLNEFIKKNLEAELVRVRKYELQPLTDIHFNTQFDSYNYTRSKESLVALALIGLFLILTACINFVNLATAQASQRAHEIGVRKVLGADRRQLVMQFLGETFLITVLAALLAIVWTESASLILGTLLNSNIGVIWSLSLFVFLFLIIFIMTLGAGFYPALILSGHDPVSVLKGRWSYSGGYSVRQGLVVLQFALSQFLIIGVLIVSLQLEFFRNQDMGFNKEALITVPIPSNEKTKLDPLRSRLLENPNIKQVSYSFASAAAPMRWTTILRYPSGNDILEIRTDMKPADPYYLSAYELKLLAGRNFSESDSFTEFVVNESLVQKLGLSSPQDAIGKNLKLDERFVPIVGVVKDFNLRSLHSAITPCVIGADRDNFQSLNIKIIMANASETLANVEKLWSDVFPNDVYSYEFLDQSLERFYQDEQRMSNIFRVFAGIAIFIGCLGLIGLVTFIAARRTKEIGVRKVVGASVAQVLRLFLKDFLRLLIIAFVISAPIAYYFLDKWLTDYAYHIRMYPGIFVAAFSISAAIAILTVGYQAFRAATANPVDALKYE